MLAMRRVRYWAAMGALVMMGMLSIHPVHAAAIRNLSGFEQNVLPANDDGSAGPVAIGFQVNFFGIQQQELFVNNNGNLTFEQSLFNFTPFDLTSTQLQIIAPYFGDVDTRGERSGLVTFGNDSVNGRPAFGVNYIGVGYFSSSTDKLNSFQVILIDRSDTGGGNFDIEFNYDQIQWETGSASGGSGGLGGSSARVGYSNGTGGAGTFFELSGSAVNGAFLDSNQSTGLTRNSLNSGVIGRYVFQSRDGALLPPEPVNDFYQMLEGDSISGNVTINDNLPNGLMRVNLIESVGNGSLSFASNGNFTYTPSRAGADQFRYELVDNDGVVSESLGTSNFNVRVDPTRALIVVIDPNSALSAQIDEAVNLANSQSRTVRVLFPAGTYQYSGSTTGSFAGPVIGSMTFESQVAGARVVVRGQGANSGRWFTVDEGVVELRGMTVQSFGIDQGGAFLVRGGGRMTVSSSTLSSNAATDGGAILVDGGDLIIQSSVFNNNSAVAGGAVLLFPDSTLDVSASTFTGNQASFDGGAINLRETFGANKGTGCADPGACPFRASIENSTFRANSAQFGGAMAIALTLGRSDDRLLVNESIFENNSASGGGCDLALQDGQFPTRKDIMTVQDSTFSGPCSTTRILHPQGGVTVTDSTVVHDGVAIDSGGEVDLAGTVLVASDLVASKRAEKDACNISGSGLLTSLGFNINSDGSCGLDQASDQANTNPQLTPGGKPGAYDLLPNSPAVDASLSLLSGLVLKNGKRTLPCGYKDANGLARPQDGNDDGVFECDVGNTELQKGADIVPAQSSAYFDPERSGEGIFVEMLDGDLAFVAMFTYPAAGEGLAWFVGLGNIMGNSVVVDDLLETSGGVFGAAYDPTRVIRSKVGSMSFNFPTCQSTTKPGRLAFQSALNTNYQDMLTNATRLSNILGCGGQANDRSGRSGSFYDPARDGEGIFVQWLTDGRVVLIWYTYDGDGNQFWTISGDVTVSGNSVTATMLYPSSTTNFGDAFDASAIGLSTWGTVTLDYTDCNNTTFSFESALPGFGSGSYSYQRLTTLSGTSCDL